MTTRLAPDAPEPPDVPDYALLRVIGRGAYGEVWLARGVTGVFRAVKIVRRSSFREDGPYEREFEGVCRFAEVSLVEPSQLALLHVGRPDAAGFFYYVMELADDVARGRDIDPASYAPHTLRELRRGPPQPVAKVLELGVALARALASLHAHGLVHRDVKPSNVIFVGGVPKLADIGLVADAEGDHSIVGTPGYMPVERGEPKSADLYALGKVLYELVTGLDRQQWPRLPGDLARREDRKALLELNEVLVRACEADPRKRFREAAAMLAELRLVQAGSPMGPLKRQLRRALRVSAVLAAVATVAAAGAWAQFKRAEKAEAASELERRRSVYSATLVRAQRALEQEDYAKARSLLRGLAPLAGQPDLRGFEWSVLQTEAQGDPADVILAEGPAIRRIVLEANGDGAAVLDARGTLSIVARADGKPHESVRGVEGVATAPDGTLAWIGQRDGTQLFGLSADSSEISRVGPELRPGSRLMAVLASSAMVLLPGKPIVFEAVPLAGSGAVRRMEVGKWNENGPWECFSHLVSGDGRWLSVVFSNGRTSSSLRRVLVVDLDSMAVLYDQIFTEIVTAAVAESGLLWICSAEPLRTECRRIADNLPMRRWEWTRTPYRLAAGDGLAVVSFEKGPLAVLHPDDPRAGFSIRGAKGRVSALALSRDRKAVLVGTMDGELRRVDLARLAGQTLAHGQVSPGGRNARIVWTQDARQFSASFDSGKSFIFDLAEPRAGPRPVPGRVLAMDGDRVWCLETTPSRLVQRRGMLVERSVELEDAESVLWPVFHSGTQTVLGADQKGCLTEWSVQTGRILRRAQVLSEAPWCIQPVPGRDHVWLTSNAKEFVEWDLRAFRPVRRFDTDSRIGAVAADFDPARIAVGTEHGVVEFIELATGATVGRIETFSGVIYRLAPEGDSRRILAAGSAGIIHVIDSSRLVEVGQFYLGQDEDVGDVSFSPRGGRLVASGSRGAIRTWAYDPP